MTPKREVTELKLDETNELFFKISVSGSKTNPQMVRLVFESEEVSHSFKGRLTEDADVMCFVVPAMKGIIKDGLYEAKVEVVVDDHYFVPVKFEANFNQSMKVVAESVSVKTNKDKPAVVVKATNVPNNGQISLREKYKKGI